MSLATASVGRKPVEMRDLIELTKPRITTMALLTAAAGVSLAPGDATVAVWLSLLVGTGLIVGAANTLNMYLERDIDCLMTRTKNRPLPGGRLDPRVALLVGVMQAAVAVPILTFALNPLTGFLGTAALILYVNAYTPLKQRTTASTLVGAIPGAMPPLMGWTAVSGSLDLGGLAVFGVLFFWQMPHFYAIALFRQSEYDGAGFKTLPAIRGLRGTRLSMLPYAVLQIACSYLLFPFGVAGAGYLAVALVFGFAYLAYVAQGARREVSPRWARNLFLASIVYLPVVFVAMLANAQH